MKFFTPEQPILLGRWNLKHSYVKCESYMKNYYGDPGYPNDLKLNWIKEDITKKYINKL